MGRIKPETGRKYPTNVKIGNSRQYFANRADVIHGVMADPDLTQKEKMDFVKMYSGITAHEVDSISAKLYRDAYGVTPNNNTPLSKTIRGILSQKRQAKADYFGY